MYFIEIQKYKNAAYLHELNSKRHTKFVLVSHKILCRYHTYCGYITQQKW